MGASRTGSTAVEASSRRGRRSDPADAATTRDHDQRPSPTTTAVGSRSATTGPTALERLVDRCRRTRSSRRPGDAEDDDERGRAARASGPRPASCRSGGAPARAGSRTARRARPAGTSTAGRRRPGSSRTPRSPRPTGSTANVPTRARNSPTNPDSPGRPAEANTKNPKIAAYTGVRAASPPILAIVRSWVRS